MQRILLVILLVFSLNYAHAQAYADSLISSGPCDPLVALTCPSGVTNPKNAVDSDQDNYAVMQSQLGVSILESRSYLDVAFQQSAYGGEAIGVVLESLNEDLNANIVDNLTVTIYDENGGIVHADSNLALQNIGLLSGTSGKRVIRIPTPLGEYRIFRVRIELEAAANVLQQLAVYGIFHEVSCPPVFADRVSFSVNVLDSSFAADDIDSSYALMNLPVSVLNLNAAQLEMQFDNRGRAGDFVGFTIQENNMLLSAALLENLVIKVIGDNGAIVAIDSNFTFAGLMAVDTLKTVLGSLLGVEGGETPGYIIGFNTPPGNYMIAGIQLELTPLLGILTDLRVYNGLYYSTLRGLPVTASRLVIGHSDSSTLTAEGGYNNYIWSNGQTGNPITVTTPGTYTVTAQRPGDECILQGSVSVRASNCNGALSFADSVIAFGNCAPVTPLCPSGVENPSFAVDNDSSSYALMVSQLGTSLIESTAFLHLGFSESANGGNEIGVVIQTINQTLNADVVDDLKITLYDENKNEVAHYDNLSLQNIGLLSGSSTLNVIRVKTAPGNYSIKSARIEMEGGVNVLQDLAVYGMFYDCACPPTKATLLKGSEFTGNPNYAADSDPANFALFNLPLNVNNEAYIELGFENPAISGDYVGFTIAKNNTMLQAGLIENLTITIYDEAGNEIAAEADFTLADLVAAEKVSGLLGGLINVGNAEGMQPYVVGFSTPDDSSYRINKVRLALAPAVGVLSDLKVFEAFYISRNSGLSVTSLSSSICAGGSTVLTASPGFSNYSWSDGSTGQSLTVTEPGLYTVTADRPGELCAVFASFAVDSASGPDSIFFDITQPTCGNNGQIVAHVWGGSRNYTYTYTNNSGKTETSQDSLITNVPPDTYEFTVTDINTGCTETRQVVLTDAPPPTFDITQPTCTDNGRIVAHIPGANSNYVYSYTGTDATVVLSQDTILDNVRSGVYYFIFTDTSTGCTRTERLIVNDAGGPVVNGYVRHATCNSSDGAIFLDVSSDYTISWSNGASDATIKNLSAGTYTVTVTDTGGCSTFASFDVLNRTLLLLEITSIDATCNGQPKGAIDLTVRVGSGNYKYQWSNGASTQDVFNLDAGVYWVVVTDLSTGCQDIIYAKVDESTSPDFGLETLKEETCAGSHDGLIRIKNVGQTDAVLWSNNSTTHEVSGLAPGIYSVEVRNTDGCSAFGFYELAARDSLNAEFVVKEECQNRNDGSITTTVTGGRWPYNLNWSKNGSMSFFSNMETVTNLSGGTYNLSLTDKNGCNRTFQVIVPVDTECGKPEKEPFIPEIVTPNYDGSNDTWKIDSLENYSTVSVEIFNRYGESVFQTNNYKNNWVGKFKDTDQDLPDGTYFYLVKIRPQEKAEKTYTGFVVLQH